MGWVEREVLKSGKTSFYFKWRVAETLNVVIDGLEYVFGTGGIHASRESITYVADKNRMIMDIDVRSMYPNLFIANRVYPEHLSETFCEIYEILYEKRKQYPKKTPQNLAIKLALNSVYGRTNDKYSVFYDPKATMTITINGQLSLCMLTEMLMKEFDDIEFIQLNTDGITYVADRKDYDAIWSVIRQWEQITGLQMEDALYSKMAIRDVNNYCAVYEESGKIKLNGAYEHRIGHIDGEGLAFHQNQSMVVIKRAAVEQIVNGIPVDKTIRSCKNPFDFCGRTKVPRSSRLVSVDEEGIEYAEQNICRYYIAKDGRSLVKIMPPLDEGKDERYLSINAGQKVRTCNDIKDFSFKDLDYDFYIQEAQKMVDNVGVKVV
jgi:DNA polymerase elongation subunit (family B)